jgi:hypothetical protein
MFVTGFQIQARIRRLASDIGVVTELYNVSKQIFPSEREQRPDLRAVESDLMLLEQKLAAAQALQDLYNSSVLVPTDSIGAFPAGDTTTLSYIIPLAGVFGRAVARWKDSSSGGKVDRYALNDRIKDLTTEAKEYQISQTESMATRRQYQDTLDMVRTAIQQANSTKLEVADYWEWVFTNDVL